MTWAEYAEPCCKITDSSIGTPATANSGPQASPSALCEFSPSSSVAFLSGQYVSLPPVPSSGPSAPISFNFSASAPTFIPSHRQAPPFSPSGPSNGSLLTSFPSIDTQTEAALARTPTIHNRSPSTSARFGSDRDRGLPDPYQIPQSAIRSTVVDVAGSQAGPPQAESLQAGSSQARPSRRPGPSSYSIMTNSSEDEEDRRWN